MLLPLVDLAWTPAWLWGVEVQSLQDRGEVPTMGLGFQQSPVPRPFLLPGPWEPWNVVYTLGLSFSV